MTCIDIFANQLIGSQPFELPYTIETAASSAAITEYAVTTIALGHKCFD